MKILPILAILLISCTANVEQSESVEKQKSVETVKDTIEKVATDIVRLEPKEFTNLPKEIISDLEKRGCTIPQSSMPVEKQNVIKGEFRQKGQADWAVLCSIDKSSTVLVYWNESTDKVAEILKQPDDDFSQKPGDPKVEFSIMINVAGAAEIDRYYRAFGGSKPPPINHQAIEYGYVEKASMIHYFDGKKWWELQGSD
jgi:hypothetical protein